MNGNAWVWWHPGKHTARTRLSECPVLMACRLAGHQDPSSPKLQKDIQIWRQRAVIKAWPLTKGKSMETLITVSSKREKKGIPQKAYPKPAHGCQAKNSGDIRTWNMSFHITVTDPEPNIWTEISWCQTVGQTSWTPCTFWCSSVAGSEWNLLVSGFILDKITLPTCKISPWVFASLLLCTIV